MGKTTPLDVVPAGAPPADAPHPGASTPAPGGDPPADRNSLFERIRVGKGKDLPEFGGGDRFVSDVS